jgi:hypothetical protein
VSIGIILFLFGAFVTGIFLRRVIKRGIEANLRKRELRRTDLCPCGYPLRQLDLARCPECGRVINFDATAEELGLSAEQLARVQDKRRRRSFEP